MRYKHYLSLVACLLLYIAATAQKPLTEGVIVYKVTIESPAKGARVSGTYTCTIKDQQIKKEIKMNNGYQDVLLFNYGKKTAYSLQVKGDKKYAIQLKIDDFMKKQDKYRDFKLQDREGETKKIAGFTAKEATITYPDSTLADLYYTPDWYPTQSIIFEHLPGIEVLPLEFTYDSKKGAMHFLAESVMSKPVENSTFHIPSDFKIISYDEYLQLLN